MYLHIGLKKIPIVARVTTNGRLEIIDANQHRFEVEVSVELLRAWVAKREPSGILQGEAESIEPTPFSLITVDDLEGRSTAEKLALLIERFSHINDLDPDLALVEALKADYKARTGREYRSDNGSDQNATEPSDIDLIKPILAEIFDAQGEVVWGAQQRVAEVLGLPGTGGAYRKRILDVLEQAKSHCLTIAMAK